MIITSLQNPTLKTAINLWDKKYRNRRGLFIVEGLREIERALSCGFEVSEVYYCTSVMNSQTKSILDQKLKSISSITELDEKCFAKLAMKSKTDGLIIVFKQKHLKLDDLYLGEKPLLVCVENLEKPGNLGALLRSCDGAKVDALVVLENNMDIYNPNVIRSSLGTLFSVPVVSCFNEEFKNYLKAKEIKSFAAILAEDTLKYTECDYTQSTALLLGSEAYGLSDFWKKNADCKVMIPMLGIADSLNVSVAGAVLIYESLRQRA